MIEVNGFIFAFSTIVIGVLDLNPTKDFKVSSIFAFMVIAVAMFLGVIYFDVLDLANMGVSIGRFYLLRDVLMPVFYGLAIIYLSAETYKEARGKDLSPNSDEPPKGNTKKSEG